MHEDLGQVPPGLPVPDDDGAAAGLLGMSVPSLRLASTRGGDLDLAEAARERVVVYIYPRTGRPDEPPPDGWDAIPGARGCTPQSCAFRDHLADLTGLGASVIGLSAQSTIDQREFAEREHIPYPLLSDPTLRLAQALGLPTFTAAGMRLYRRLTFVASRGRIEKVFYPVVSPDRNAHDVLEWLARA